MDALITEAQAIYKINFFPEMKADWRAHPDHIGHKDSNGCFRCHDGKHLAGDGKTSIKGSDCNACHLIMAQGAGKELEKVDPEGRGVFPHRFGILRSVLRRVPQRPDPGRVRASISAPFLLGH